MPLIPFGWTIPGKRVSERLVRPSRIFVWEGTFIMEMLTVAKTRRVMDS